nr:plasmid partitioning/stability family protein [Escherichia coli]
MDDERKRKKFTLYLHPEKAADFQTLEAIESVPRSERGELFRNAFISGMALQRHDESDARSHHGLQSTIGRRGCRR